jgi:hypothetical protein
MITNPSRILRSHALRRSFVAVVLLLSFFASASSAQGNSSISQQFQSKDPDITVASLVVIQKDNPSSIELSSQEKASTLVGVVSEEPLIELSDDSNGVQVVTSGLTMTLVSDINGIVTTGDKITASPIKGVGMKASESTTTVGIAQSPLDISKAEKRKIMDTTGKQVEVRIGLVPVQVGVATYIPESNKTANFVPQFLQSLANSVAGRTVSPARVLVAALILLLLFVSITVLLYSSVRSSIISIGRNPLSERAVRKSLLQVGLTVLGILLFTVGLVYLVLTA